MSSNSTRAISGCIVWVLVFTIISSCLGPVAMFVGGFSSGSGLAMNILGPLVCPEGTTAEAYSYQSTIQDEFGNPQPATATELHCVDNAGNVVKSDPVGFAFLWVAILVVTGLAASALLAFAFAAPAGVLLGNLIGKLRKKGT